MASATNCGCQQGVPAPGVLLQPEPRALPALSSLSSTTRCVLISRSHSTYADYFDHTNAVKVWGNYVYLDTEERRRFAQKGHEYLIEQVQHTGVDTVTAGRNQAGASVLQPPRQGACLVLLQRLVPSGPTTTCGIPLPTLVPTCSYTANPVLGGDCRYNVFTSPLSVGGAPKMVVGVNAVAGQHLPWVGEDGPAESGNPTVRFRRSSVDLQADPQRSGPVQGAVREVLQPGAALLPPLRKPLPGYLLILLRAQARGAPAHGYLQLLAH